MTTVQALDLLLICLHVSFRSNCTNPHKIGFHEFLRGKLRMMTTYENERSAKIFIRVFNARFRLPGFENVIETTPQHLNNRILAFQFFFLMFISPRSPRGCARDFTIHFCTGLQKLPIPWINVTPEQCGTLRLQSSRPLASTRDPPSVSNLMRSLPLRP